MNRKGILLLILVCAVLFPMQHTYVYSFDRDFGFVSVDMKKYYKINETIYLKAILKNFGSDTAYAIPGKVQIYFDNYLTNPVMTFNVTIHAPNLFIGDTVHFNVPQKFIGTKEGIYHIKFTIQPSEDDDKNEENNVIMKSIVVVGGNIEKRLLLEKFTGTWCGNCPKADVIFQERLKDFSEGKYYNMVAIHFGDVMQIPDSDTLINYFCRGYPSIMFDRMMLPGEVEQDVINYRHWEPHLRARDTAATPVSVNITPIYVDEDTIPKVTINVEVVFKATTFGKFKLLLYKIESSIIGGEEYDQTNYCDQDPEWPELNGLGDYISGYRHKNVLTKIISSPLGDLIETPDTIQKGERIYIQYQFRSNISLIPNGTLPLCLRNSQVRSIAKYLIRS